MVANLIRGKNEFISKKSLKNAVKIFCGWNDEIARKEISLFFKKALLGNVCNLKEKIIYFKSKYKLAEELTDQILQPSSKVIGFDASILKEKTDQFLSILSENILFKNKKTSIISRKFRQKLTGICPNSQRKYEKEFKNLFVNKKFIIVDFKTAMINSGKSIPGSFVRKNNELLIPICNTYQIKSRKSFVIRNKKAYCNEISGQCRKDAVLGDKAKVFRESFYKKDKHGQAVEYSYPGRNFSFRKLRSEIA